ncbi:hypothetical protein TpMuguga_01g00408 [Theileria parva strain Muguga]|uniref:SfiI-subtelomeric related protein family member n=1 Tax=Theileria parva TaxID=5875 RepID=Q4N8Q6_THEPA|nr:uncharacterized protein TpMuguga_01g00408 [Theileria parva strain Muguga]EAN33652.1 hypothetical protein TpMuguga_01g00408 [Theileria parva strain Muguga]|eukprot:XP_765935.1 hypothetical protein [Theileria parva strain Muguga]
MLLLVKLLLLFGLLAARPPVHSVTLELTELDNDFSKTTLSYFVSSTMVRFDVKDDKVVDKVTLDNLSVWSPPDDTEKLRCAKVIYNEFGPRLVLLDSKSKYGKHELLYYIYTLNGWVLLNSVNPFNISLQENEVEKEHKSPLHLVNGDVYTNFTHKLGKTDGTVDTVKNSVVKTQQLPKAVDSGKSSDLSSLVLATTTSGNTSVNTVNSSNTVDGVDGVDIFGISGVDLSNVPEPPVCRKCTYVVDGILYTIHYFHFKTKFRRVYYEGQQLYEVPKGKHLSGSCVYSRNSKVIFVDFLLSSPGKTHFVYFEHTSAGFVKLPKEEFNERLQKYKSIPTTVDLSTFNSKTYSVTTSKRLNKRKMDESVSKVDCMLYTPNDGYVIRRVIDGDLLVLESDNDILEVLYYNLGGQKLLSMILQEGANFQYEYYTYFGDLGKWSKSSEYFYYKLIDEYVKKSEGKFSLDLKTTTNNKYLIVQKDGFLNHLSYFPTTSALVNVVYDHGRLVWTARKPRESCIFVWHQYLYNLVYVVSTCDGQHTNYHYQKNGETWSFIAYEEFRRRFSFIYSTNDVLDLKDNFVGFDVTENGNAFTIKPKHFHLISKVTYGSVVLWNSLPNLKCFSAKIIYGANSTQAYLYLKDYEGRTFTTLYKTVDNDFTKWELSYSETATLDEVGTLPTNVKVENFKDKVENKVEDSVGNALENAEKLEKLEYRLEKLEDNLEKVEEKSDNATVDTTDKVEENAEKEDKLDSKLELTDKVENRDENTLENTVDKDENRDDNTVENTVDKVDNTLENTLDKDENTVENTVDKLDSKLEATDKVDDKADVDKSVETVETTVDNGDKVVETVESIVKLVDVVDGYLGGVFDLQKMKKTEYGDYVDARKYGLNYLLFTPHPGYPVRDLRDGLETIWKSSTQECVALSVFLRDDAPVMVELFVKCSVEVSRKFFQLKFNRWYPVDSHTYDILTDSLQN